MTQRLIYAGVFLASLLTGLVVGWLGAPIDDSAYDWMFSHYRPELAAPRSILLTIDDNTLTSLGGIRRLRRSLALGLERMLHAQPRAVAIDVILADEGDPADDAALESALSKVSRLVLACELVDPGPRWENPLGRFQHWARALGHVHADFGHRGDSTCRQIPLEKAAAHMRRWALALETYRLYAGAPVILETPQDLQVGPLTIPASRSEGRALRVRYLPASLPRVSVRELLDHPELAGRFRDKVVFVGVTAQSAAQDRWMTPYSNGVPMPGVEIHANAFETIAQRQFLVNVPVAGAVLFAVLLAAGGVLSFALVDGSRAYFFGLLVLACAHLGPYWLFTRHLVMPYFPAVSAAWLSVFGAGAFRLLAVRRQLFRSEAEKSRYQQAMHFVTHEMRTPLTAIQGSSELMGRYNLSDEKRKQMATLINTESKRLARMVETFLSVERLSAGQMQLKKEEIPLAGLVEICVARVRPIAERKQIDVEVEDIPPVSLSGDRELMEYAVYNLLSNAIKYSPAETRVSVRVELSPDGLRLAVQDQGIGMDEQELRNIFRKFYRTGRAVASGEAGSGIGLSIVEQIVTHHGGKIEVASSPGKGSCFTIALPRTRMND